jgi:hypothetical protein
VQPQAWYFKLVLEIASGKSGPMLSYLQIASDTWPLSGIKSGFPLGHNAPWCYPP